MAGVLADNASRHRLSCLERRLQPIVYIFYSTFAQWHEYRLAFTNQVILKEDGEAAKNLLLFIRSSSNFANLNASGIRSPNFSRAELGDWWDSSLRTQLVYALYKFEFTLQSRDLFIDFRILRSLQEAYQDTASTKPTKLVSHDEYMKHRSFDSYRAEGVEECDIEACWINAVYQVQNGSGRCQYF